MLPGGTGFLSDLGMTGVTESIIGGDTAAVLPFYRTHVRKPIAEAKGACRMNGALFTINAETGRCAAIQRIQF
ncbi:MAG: YmdB family metallophosphoesterase [Clostridia bacterium]|nr:YmdB family metallophosphoesterase [Clostridia bacterium]